MVHAGVMDAEYTVVLDSLEDGGYRAWCPELDGCFAEGGTYDEVLEAIGRAIEGRVAPRTFVLRAVSSEHQALERE